MKVVAFCVPTGWAMDALHQLISFGGGWETILSKLGVLALFATGANIGAAAMFRY
jgi:ABC-type multidrug transport system permease subunit